MIYTFRLWLAGILIGNNSFIKNVVTEDGKVYITEGKCKISNCTFTNTPIVITPREIFDRLRNNALIK